jgi:hypothetical protein
VVLQPQSEVQVELILNHRAVDIVDEGLIWPASVSWPTRPAARRPHEWRMICATPDYHYATAAAPG